MKLFKQPMIIGYILAGTVISLFLPNLLHGNSSFESFGNLGISFLLFMVGMELNPSLIKDIGKSSVFAGSLQVLITSLAGRGIALLLGLDMTTAAYVGVGFSFSSTIVVLKLLGDKEEMESTFGRLSIGILIVQDIIVMLLMLGLATFKNIGDASGFLIIGGLVLKMIGLGGGIYLASKYFIPRITKFIAESQEYLFLFAIGRCFILGSMFHLLGFGIEIGTLVAGITLASSSYRFEIASKIKSLKDFFIVIFFVLLGSHVDFKGVLPYLPVVIVFTLFVLIGKPIITSIILGILGHTKKNNLLTGISLGQISEFSFLLVSMGMASGAIHDQKLLGIVTLIGLLSIAGSSYGVMYSEKLYYFLKPYIGRLPGLRNKEYKKINKKTYEIMLFGYGRFGSNLHDYLYKKDRKILVIDEHPGIIQHLQDHAIDCLYGDAGDADFLEELNIKDTKMIISTIKKFDENMILLKTIKSKNKSLIVILVSNHVQEALKLYEQGADYVVLPHYIGVDHTSLMLEEYGFDMEKFLDNKKTQLSNLQKKQEEHLLQELL